MNARPGAIIKATPASKTLDSPGSLKPNMSRDIRLANPNHKAAQMTEAAVKKSHLT